MTQNVVGYLFIFYSPTTSPIKFLKWIEKPIREIFSFFSMLDHCMALKYNLSFLKALIFIWK